jgi:GcrA cell cycle regulator
MRLGDRGAMGAVAHRTIALGRRGPARCAAFALSAAQNQPPEFCEAVFMTLATWNTERVEQLRHFVGAGLTCSQIAAEIGVTRNAVIGKIHRLGLGPGRPAAAPGRPCPPRLRRPRASTQRALLRLITADAPDTTADGALETAVVESAQLCSLLELARGRCRWPVGDPGKTDFAFCGNETAAGFSYCAGHARMAYRPAARRRA